MGVLVDSSVLAINDPSDSATREQPDFGLETSMALPQSRSLRSP